MALIGPNAAHFANQFAQTAFHGITSKVLLLLYKPKQFSKVRSVIIFDDSIYFKQGNRRPQLTGYTSLWKDRSGARSNEVRVRRLSNLSTLFVMLIVLNQKPCMVKTWQDKHKKLCTRVQHLAKSQMISIDQWVKLGYASIYFNVS